MEGVHVHAEDDPFRTQSQPLGGIPEQAERILHLPARHAQVEGRQPRLPLQVRRLQLHHPGGAEHQQPAPAAAQQLQLRRVVIRDQRRRQVQGIEAERVDEEVDRSHHHELQRQHPPEQAQRRTIFDNGGRVLR